MNLRVFPSRRGIGLAEALVMIIVSGQLLVPILGSLLQGVGQTADLKHQTLARQLALSAQADLLRKIPIKEDLVNTQVDHPTTDGATLTVRTTFALVKEMDALGELPTFAEARTPRNIWAYRIDVERVAGPDTATTSLSFLTGLLFTAEAYEENLFVSSPALGWVLSAMLMAKIGTCQPSASTGLVMPYQGSR